MGGAGDATTTGWGNGHAGTLSVCADVISVGWNMSRSSWIVADNVDAGPAGDSRSSVASSVDNQRRAFVRSVTAAIIASRGECPGIVNATGNQVIVSVIRTDLVAGM